MIEANSPSRIVAKYPRKLVNPPLVETRCALKQCAMRVGFAGLGLMGRPMATNLLRAGADLTVYNRSAEPRAALAALGAGVAATPRELFARSDAVILMLATEEACDIVLGRHDADFQVRVAGKLIVNMGTHAPAYSVALERAVVAAGGQFVEAPVSGSRGPAEAGELVAMLAGAPEAVAQATSLIQPLCGELIEVGAVPSAMAMKLAVNLYLITSVTALAEATCLAAASGLDLERFQSVIARGPLGSPVVRAKLDKMVRSDFAPQAAIGDVLKNARLVAQAAAQVASEAPLLRESLARFEMAASRGGETLDMAAILLAYQSELSSS